MRKTKLFKYLLVHPEHFFLIIAAFFGLIFVLLIPPMQAPDELSHFFRSYEVGHGQIVAKEYTIGNITSVGGRMPESLKQMSYKLLVEGGDTSKKITIRQIAHYFKTPLNKSVIGPVQYAGSALYSPIPYIPQAVGINIGYVLNLPPLALFYLDRLFNLLAFLGGVWFAIRILPVGKWALVVIALLPTVITQAASSSADNLTNVLSFIAVAYVFKLYYENKKIDLSNIFYLITLFVLLALCKNVFALLSLIVLILPLRNFVDQQKARFYQIAIIIVSLLTAALWSHEVYKFVPYAARSFKPELYVSTTQQIATIITNPLHFIIAIFDTYFGYWGSTFIASFTSTQYAMPLFFVMVSYLTLVFVCLSNKEKLEQKIGNKTRLFLYALCLFIILAITFTLYATYNPVGYSTVEGLNGRYFIPLGPIFIILLLSSKWRLSIPTSHNYRILGLGIMLPILGLLIKLSNSFYGWHF